MKIALVVIALMFIFLTLALPTCGFHRRNSVRGHPEFIDQEKYYQLRCQGVQKVSGPYDDFTGVFKYENSIITHATNNFASLAGYRSVHYAPKIVIDLDGDEAFAHAQIFYRFLTKNPRVPEEAITTFFSGKRGVHFYIDIGTVGAEPDALFHQCLKVFCCRLAEEAGVVIDMAVYGPLQLSRSPNAKHSGSGLYKTVLWPSELFGTKWEEVKEMAQEPRYFEPLPAVDKVIPELASRWKECVEAATNSIARRTATNPGMAYGRVASTGAALSGGAGHQPLGLPKFSRKTLDFIKSGAVEGTRHTRLVAAAKNFTDFGPGAKGFAYDLLYPPALRCGLPDQEITSVIEWAFGSVGGRT